MTDKRTDWTRQAQTEGSDMRLRYRYSTPGMPDYSGELNMKPSVKAESYLAVDRALMAALPEMGRPPIEITKLQAAVDSLEAILAALPLDTESNHVRQKLHFDPHFKGLVTALIQDATKDKEWGSQRRKFVSGLVDRFMDRTNSAVNESLKILTQAEVGASRVN